MFLPRKSYKKNVRVTRCRIGFTSGLFSPRTGSIVTRRSGYQKYFTLVSFSKPERSHYAQKQSEANPASCNPGIRQRLGVLTVISFVSCTCPTVGSYATIVFLDIAKNFHGSFKLRHSKSPL